MIGKILAAIFAALLILSAVINTPPQTIAELFGQILGAIIAVGILYQIAVWISHRLWKNKHSSK